MVFEVACDNGRTKRNHRVHRSAWVRHLKQPNTIIESSTRLSMISKTTKHNYWVIDTPEYDFLKQLEIYLEIII